MGLIVWLPMNGNLNNQGLSNYQATNTNAIINTNGKIGKCYQFGTGQSYLELPKECMRNLSTECTVSFWIKFITRNSNYETYFQAGLGGAAWNNYVFGLLRNNSGNSCCFTISNGSSASNASYTTPNLTELNTWYHITLVYKTGHCLIYMNGELYQDYTTTIIPAFDKITTITIGCCNTKTSYQTNCLMNDFRIYDEALSPREIKEISKGLVLHYSLNHEGFGQDNLLINTNDLTRWGKESGISVEWDDSVQMYKVTDSSHTSSRWGIYQDFACEPSTTYTFSVTGKKSDNNVNMGVQSFESAVSWSANVASFSENPERKSYTITTGANHTKIRIYLNMNPTTTASNTAYYLLPKLELGSVATPWTPAPSDALYSQMGLDNNIEYDVSGYGNDGTRIGTFSWSSDTPRYNTSTYASGSASTYLEGSKLPSEAKTVSLWIKCSKTVNSAIFNDKTSGLQIGLLNSLLYINSLASTAGFTTTHWINDEWNHVVAINNNGTRSVYVNGQPETQSGASNYYLHNSDNFWLWKRSYNNSYTFTGSLSDLRVYVTPLSEDDVLELYHTPISLSNNGTLMAQGEYVEV